MSIKLIFRINIIQILRLFYWWHGCEGGKEGERVREFFRGKENSWSQKRINVLQVQEQPEDPRLWLDEAGQ